MSLPDAAEYDEDNQFHVTTKKMLDLTNSDIEFLNKEFSQITREEIESTGISHLYDEASENWALNARDSAKAFVQIEQYKGGG